jgi:hypothetical protein
MIFRRRHANVVAVLDVWCDPEQDLDEEAAESVGEREPHDQD